MQNYATSFVKIKVEIPDRSQGPLPPMTIDSKNNWGYNGKSVPSRRMEIDAINIGGRITQYIQPTERNPVDPLLVDAFGAWDISELTESELSQYQVLLKK